MLHFHVAEAHLQKAPETTLLTHKSRQHSYGSIILNAIFVSSFSFSKICISSVVVNAISQPARQLLALAVCYLPTSAA